MSGFQYFAVRILSRGTAGKKEQETESPTRRECFIAMMMVKAGHGKNEARDGKMCYHINIMQMIQIMRGTYQSQRERQGLCVGTVTVTGTGTGTERIILFRKVGKGIFITRH